VKNKGADLEESKSNFTKASFAKVRTAKVNFGKVMRARIIKIQNFQKNLINNRNPETIFQTF
jgi:hypothetical protein